GATTTKITVTNDLDEYALASLQTAPVDSYGVGTMLVTGSGAPTCAMVYKLSEREGSDGAMVPVAKKSPDKATVPGRKLAYRSYEYGLADCEHVISGSEEQLAAFAPDEGWKNLLVQYMDGGKPDPRYQGHEAITAAHAYRAKALSELPITAQSLMKGDPVIPTEVLNL
ncbi:MAG: nicotinate phosphoribosyltransferase, partial [Bifidobacterium crudilactis]|nr:nicotinate phosphoribosyltransferase [Bifidobacterium crudilactis]